jgi:hypothetical protein
VSKPAKNRTSAVVTAGPQRVLVITARGRRRLAWLDADGTVVDRRPT